MAVLNTTQPGLSTAEALTLMQRWGRNAIHEQERRPLRDVAKRFWAPIPWLLEATILLQLFLGERVEAAVIGCLLVLNAVLGLVQESRAQRALSLLRQQLHVRSRVLRDGAWTTIAAEDLVPGDIVHLRQGGIVPADIHLSEGVLEVDQSALTGESAGVTQDAGALVYAGSLVRSGEATGQVVSTGARTFFGTTAELVRTAGQVSRQEHEIIAVVKHLIVINVALVVLVTGYAHATGMSLEQTVPLLLSILLASIPVALPATFTLAAALGSLELSKQGVLITRLSALHDIASMTILCSDKTGTLTCNQATVKALSPVAPASEQDLALAAAWASDPSGQDPVDAAILVAAQERGWRAGMHERIAYTPFDPAIKRSESSYRMGGGIRRYTKGAPAVIAAIAHAPMDAWGPSVQLLVDRGLRVLAVASGDADSLALMGFIGLEDAVRADSRAVVQAVTGAGVRVVMVTGDNALTAQSVAHQVGLNGDICPSASLRSDIGDTQLACAVFAGVLPQDKIRLVRAFQRRGGIVGMSGDGVNDAPALRQAEVGIAVANATDVAKASAALVLTQPGLGGVLPAIMAGRRVFQRIVTYTLAMLIKKIEMMLLLVVGFLVTRHAPLTPMLMVLILFLNDFLTMSITTDRMGISPMPTRWNTRAILIAALVLAACKLAFSLGVFLVGYSALHLAIGPLRTLTFATLILSSQAGVYLTRERGHLWHSRPSPFLIASTLFGLGVAALLALSGVVMPATTPSLLLEVAAAGVVMVLLIDALKVWLFSRLNFR